MIDMPVTENRVLLVDDDEDILEFLEYNLENAGFSVRTTTFPEEVLSLALQWLPHVIVLDVMMPKIDGVELCRQLRQKPELYKSMILFLSARNEEYTQVAAFDQGADAYIAKPIKPKAFISRIKALTSRNMVNENQAYIFSSKKITLNPGSYQVFVDGNQVTLPKKEFDLLCFLMKNEERVIGREEILNKVWGTDVIVSARTVDVHIRKIRQKVGEHYIKTIKGVGYMF
jgi:two-component system alkaline phosphatase synthesis response regulator PhoP